MEMGIELKFWYTLVITLSCELVDDYLSPVSECGQLSLRCNLEIVTAI